MKKVLWLLLSFLILFGLSSCGMPNSSDNEQLPGIDLPITEYNQKVVLQDNAEFLNTYKLGSVFVLEINNQSKDEIIFPPDFGLKIFIREQGNWSEVENRTDFADYDNLLLTNSEWPSGLDLVFMPYIADLDASTNIRVTIVGHVKDKPDELVGAFIDLPLKP